MHSIKTIGEAFNIKATKSLPEVYLSPQGIMSISGRMINDDLIDFFNPIFSYAQNLKCETIYFDINLEYVNTSGTFLLVKLMKMLELNCYVKHLEITWHYDEDDEEHYDVGCLMKQSIKRAAFNFIRTHSSEQNTVEDYLLKIKAKKH